MGGARRQNDTALHERLVCSLLGPMAYTVIGGLFVATLLTLLFLPALYVAWFRIKEPEPRLEAGLPAAAE